MTNNQSLHAAVNRRIKNLNSDLVWGVGDIGAIINRTGRQTYHLLARGEIKSARKVGGRWVASRAALLREFGAV